MSTTQDLITIKVHTDTDTGMHYVGEMDYRVPFSTKEWLQGECRGQSNRETLASWLEDLAESCRNHCPPFGTNYKKGPEAQGQIEMNMSE